MSYAMPPSLKGYVVVRGRWQGPLLGLQSRAQDFVWVRSRRCAHLAKHCCSHDAEPMHLFGLSTCLAHLQASELHFQVLVKRKLDSDVSEAEKSGRES